MIKYYSYDIFDTCFVRTCGRPDIVFDILAREVLGEGADFNLIADFAYERKEGEKRTREKLCDADHEDITFDQIYEECDFSAYANTPNNLIKTKELELEREILRPVKTIKNEIDEHRKNGAQILFISDMYLSSEFLREILTKYGFFKDGDRVFVSNEAAATKGSGNLYRFVAKEMGITNFKEWLHTGDNKYADCCVPKRLGICVRHISHDYTYYEKHIACCDYTSQSFEAKKLASISRSVLCELGTSPRKAFAADFIAPIYVPFVEHILAHANNHGIKKLYFMARDGYIMYKIAELLGKNYPDISLHYLYVSRDSLYLPGLPNVSYESVSKCFLNFDSFGAEDIITRLHMTQFSYSDIPLEGKKGQEALQTMLNNENFRTALERKRLEQRKLCCKYFEQEGLTESNSAVVDLAGARMCHTALNKILDLGKEHEVFGYYLIVNFRREVGTNYYALNYKDRMFNNLINCNTQPQYLLENYFSVTDQNRTHEYKMEGDMVVPVFEEDATDSEFRRAIYDINEMVCLDFATKYMLISDRDKSLEHSGYGMSAYSNFLLAPEYYYVKALEGVQLSETKNIHSPVLTRKRYKSENDSNLLKLNMVYNSWYPHLTTLILRNKMNNSKPESVV